jgi:2-iminobutanoate/2-iminopropanoate deaminase
MKGLWSLAGAAAFCAMVVGASADGAGRESMSRQIIRTADAPKNPLYSQAVRVGRDVYVTGMLGIDPKTSVFGATIQEQVRQSLVNCQNVLRTAGTSLDNVVEVQVLLARPADFEGLNQEYAKFFPSDPPIRSVARLGPELPNVLVSIKMHAVIAD